MACVRSPTGKTNYLYFSILSQKFSNLKIALHKGERITLYDTRYKLFYIYIVRSSDKCFKLYATYKFNIFTLSFRTTNQIIDILKKLDTGDLQLWITK